MKVYHISPCQKYCARAGCVSSVRGWRRRKGRGRRTYHQQLFEVGEGLDHPDVLAETILNHCIELSDYGSWLRRPSGGLTQLQADLMRHHERHDDQHGPVVRPVTRPIELLRAGDEPQSHERDGNGIERPHDCPTLGSSVAYRIAARVRGETLRRKGFLDGAVGADAGGRCGGEVGVGTCALGVGRRAAVLRCEVCYAGRLCVSLVPEGLCMHDELERLTAHSGIVSARTTSSSASSSRLMFWPATSARRADKQQHSSAGLGKRCDDAIFLRHVKRDLAKRPRKTKKASSDRTRNTGKGRGSPGTSDSA